MHTLAELQAQRQALDEKIAKELETSLAQALQDCKGLITLHGFTPADLFGAKGARKPRSDAGKRRGPRKPKPLAIAA